LSVLLDSFMSISTLLRRWLLTGPVMIYILDNMHSDQCWNNILIAFQWDTLKSVVKSKSGKSVLPHVKPGPVRSQRRSSVDMDIKLSRRTDNFTLSDYTPQKLAEQLTYWNAINILFQHWSECILSRIYIMKDQNKKMYKYNESSGSKT
jgi:hypothetical protein